MRVLVERGCGLDVGQAVVLACVLLGQAGEEPQKRLRTFGTTTQDLLGLRDWLKGLGVSHVAMESTGIYWNPIHAVLEDDFEIIVANAKRIKAVPGRKTDVRDSEWIADLLRHGLISASFVPTRPLRELRDLLRYRNKLVAARTSERNRVLKLLETANIKLASVASDVFGVSGTKMLKALIEGHRTPEAMAEMAQGRLRRKIPMLKLALEGRLEEHHRFLLRLQLRRLEHLEADITSLDGRIDEKLRPFQLPFQRLREIPGVDRVVAATLIAEMGIDMTVFRSPGHLASWAGICPGTHESAGKRKSAPVVKGNVHLKVALVQAAKAAFRQKHSYLRVKFLRLQARRGPKRATIAIAHKILIAAYHVLATGSGYRDLGPAYLDQLRHGQTVRNLVHRLEHLGYHVSLDPKTAA
jgi:transposase